MRVEVKPIGMQNQNSMFKVPVGKNFIHLKTEIDLDRGGNRPWLEVNGNIIDSIFGDVYKNFIIDIRINCMSSVIRTSTQKILVWSINM